MSLRVISFLFYGAVCFLYALLWGDVSAESILAYVGIRDAIIFNTFVALILTALLLWGWKNCNKDEKKPHVHSSSWFLYLTILLGVYNFNRLPAFSSIKEGILKSTAWSDVPLTGLLSAFQCWALIFGIVLVAIEFFIYHRK